MIDTLIRRREVTNKRILKTWNGIKKLEETIRGLHSSSAATSAEGESAEKLIASYSPDIRLENLSLIKKYKIDEIVHKMFLDDDTKVKQVEEFEDETTKHLKESLRSGKDPKTIIKEQEQILKNRALSYLKYADKLNEMFVMKTFQAVQNKEGEALQEYYTPDEIADELIGYSEMLTHVNSETHLRILEPSAGAGGLINAIIRARQQYNMNSGYTIEAIEYNNVSWELLKHVIEEKKMEEVIVLQEQRDFLNYVSNEQYDMIVMNPPFHLKKRFTGLKADMWDGDFVARGYALLKPGGEMLIIATSMMRKMSHNTLIGAKRKGLEKFGG
jgi:16S rRNA G966 N2-methylase RsmD